MHGPRVVPLLLLVFGGSAATMLVLGVAVNPVALGVGVPFAIATGILYYHASGRLARDTRRRARRTRQRRRQARQARETGRRARQRRREETDPTPTAAYRALGVEPGDGEDAVRRAYRRQVKEVHPDHGGDEASFKRLERAYQRALEHERGG